jgi:hypothetical protein
MSSDREGRPGSRRNVEWLLRRIEPARFGEDDRLYTLYPECDELEFG